MKNEYWKSGTKICRQICIYNFMITTEYHGPAEIMDSVTGLSMRMLQRDLKDLTDAGLVSVKYDKATKNYVKTENEPTFNESIEGKRRSHLIRLNRLCHLLHELDWNTQYLINDYLWDCDCADEGEVIPVPDNLPDAREYYQSAYPECSLRTMQRDFRILNSTGIIEIKYSRRFKIFIVYAGQDMEYLTRY